MCQNPILLHFAMWHSVDAPSDIMDDSDPYSLRTLQKKQTRGKELMPISEHVRYDRFSQFIFSDIWSTLEIFILDLDK